MPELPEVEITRRQLRPALLGRTITRLSTSAPSYFFITPPATLRTRLRDQRVAELSRVGKYLLLQLQDPAGTDTGRLLLHLGMTGQLFLAGGSSVPLLRTTGTGTLGPEQQRRIPLDDPHVHLRFEFDRGPRLLFRDPRKFGKVQWLPAGAACERLDRLGVDALAAEGAALHAASRRRRAAIKTVLLDQAVLAGVGNIYADEGLFIAGVRPTTPAMKLGRARCDRIVAGVQQVMLRSIETGGSSISDYVHTDGQRGRYQDERRVYAREGLPCPACGRAIERIVLGQRSTHYCPRCQR